MWKVDQSKVKGKSTDGWIALVRGSDVDLKEKIESPPCPLMHLQKGERSIRWTNKVTRPRREWNVIRVNQNNLALCLVQFLRRRPTWTTNVIASNIGQFFSFVLYIKNKRFLPSPLQHLGSINQVFFAVEADDNDNKNENQLHTHRVCCHRYRRWHFNAIKQELHLQAVAKRILIKKNRSHRIQQGGSLGSLFTRFV